MTPTIDLRVLTPQKCIDFHDFPLLFRSCSFHRFLIGFGIDSGHILARFWRYFHVFRQPFFTVFSNAIFMVSKRVLGRKGCSGQLGLNSAAPGEE